MGHVSAKKSITPSPGLLNYPTRSFIQNTFFCSGFHIAHFLAPWVPTSWYGNLFPRKSKNVAHRVVSRRMLRPNNASYVLVDHLQRAFPLSVLFSETDCSLRDECLKQGCTARVTVVVLGAFCIDEILFLCFRDVQQLFFQSFRSAFTFSSISVGRRRFLSQCTSVRSEQKMRPRAPDGITFFISCTAFSMLSFQKRSEELIRPHALQVWYVRSASSRFTC